MENLEALAKTATRIIFSNGLQDPWSAQSVTSELAGSLVAVNIPDGSHHSDLGAPPNPTPTKEDSPTLKAAGAKELAILKRWLAEAQQERREGHSGIGNI